MKPALGLTIAVFGLAIFSVCTHTVQAQFNYTVANGTITITRYTGPGGHVAIPSEVNGLPVTRIGDYAFDACTNLTSIVIPNSVTSIEERAFGNCRNLTSVTIPSSVTSIGPSAFLSCASLSSISIPNGVTWIGGWAFCDTGLTSATIPSSVTSIQDGTFAWCTSLTTLTLPDSITWIGGWVFEGCASLTNVALPDGVTWIGDYAFDACSSLTTMTVPDNVTWIGGWAFRHCQSLASVTIPQSVTTIGPGAFQSCASLTSITVDPLNPSYSSLDGVVFDVTKTRLLIFPGGKSGSYTIPDTVTSIADQAFYQCTGLTSLTIPKSVGSLGTRAFSGCINLTAVYFWGDAPYVGADAFTGTPATIYHLPETLSWGTVFGGRPTALWVVPNLAILGRTVGIRANAFSFRLSGATNAAVVVEASPDLTEPSWSPVSAKTLTGGWADFSDPKWTNYPRRFYRVRSP